MHVLAAGDGVTDPLEEIQRLDVFGNQRLQWPPQQIGGPVAHFLFEIAVDRCDPPLGIQGQEDHFLVETFPDLLRGDSSSRNACSSCLRRLLNMVWTQ